jgi:hypothetical protein
MLSESYSVIIDGIHNLKGQKLHRKSNFSLEPVRSAVCCPLRLDLLLFTLAAATKAAHIVVKWLDILEICLAGVSYDTCGDPRALARDSGVSPHSVIFWPALPAAHAVHH